MGDKPRITFTFDACSYTVITDPDGKPITPLTAFGKKKEKQLIKRLTGRVDAGHVLAILGPSGAGKTTLLNMLTLQAPLRLEPSTAWDPMPSLHHPCHLCRARISSHPRFEPPPSQKLGGKPSGNIYLNGKPFTLATYNSSCAYVTQFDTLW